MRLLSQGEILLSEVDKWILLEKDEVFQSPNNLTLPAFYPSSCPKLSNFETRNKKVRWQSFLLLITMGNTNAQGTLGITVGFPAERL